MSTLYSQAVGNTKQSRIKLGIRSFKIGLLIGVLFGLYQAAVFAFETKLLTTAIISTFAAYYLHPIGIAGLILVAVWLCRERLVWREVWDIVVRNPSTFETVEDGYEWQKYIPKDAAILGSKRVTACMFAILACFTMFVPWVFIYIYEFLISALPFIVSLVIAAFCCVLSLIGVMCKVDGIVVDCYVPDKQYDRLRSRDQHYNRADMEPVVSAD